MDIEEIKALFATLANCESLNDTTEPNTLSLSEIQAIGRKGLDLLEETATA